MSTMRWMCETKLKKEKGRKKHYLITRPQLLNQIYNRLMNNINNKIITANTYSIHIVLTTIFPDKSGLASRPKGLWCEDLWGRCPT